MPHVFSELFNRKAQVREAQVNEASAGPWLGLCGHCPAITLRLERVLDTSSSVCTRALFTALALVDYTGRNFGQVCFCNNPFSGLLTLVGISISNPEAAFSGLAASTVSLLLSMALQQPRASLAAGLAGINGVLFGSVIPVVLNIPEPWRWPLVCGGGALTAVLNSSLSQVLASFRPPLPVLSLPFNLLGVLTSLMLMAVTSSTPQPSAVSVNDSNATLPIDYAMVLQGGLLGPAQAFAIDDVWCAGLVLFGIAVFSPLLAITSFLGSLATTCFGVLSGAAVREAAYAGVHGTNGMMTACAICVFFVPTWRSALLAVAAVTFTGAVQLVLYSYLIQTGVPMLSIPFVVSTLLVLGVSSDGLPRPALISYPELHRALWLRQRREERRDTLHSLNLGLHSPSTLRMTRSTTSMALESVSLSVPRSVTPNPSTSQPSRSTLDVPCTPVYRPQQQRY